MGVLETRDSPLISPDFALKVHIPKETIKEKISTS
jgi:hypothetical protein